MQAAQKATKAEKAEKDKKETDESGESKGSERRLRRQEGGGVGPGKRGQHGIGSDSRSCKHERGPSGVP